MNPVDRHVLTSFPSRAVWSPRWIAPYESLFSILQKFAWANATDAAQTFKVLRGKHIHRSSAQQSFGFIPSLLSCKAWQGATIPPKFRLVKGTLGFFATEWWTMCLGSDKHFRFCETCSQLAYHTPFFQISGILRCPIHYRALRTACAHCGEPTPPYALVEKAFERPYFCGHCRKPLAREFHPDNFQALRDFRQLTASAMLPIVRWLGELHYVPVPVTAPPHEDYPLSSLSTLNHENDIEDPTQAFFDIANRMCPLRLPPQLIFRSRRPIRATKLRTRRPWSNWGFPSELTRADRLRAKADRSVFNSIRRYLVHEYLGAHRPCLDAAMNDLMPGSYSGYIPLSWEICPVAQAFVRWKLSYAWMRSEGFESEHGHTVDAGTSETNLTWSSELRQTSGTSYKRPLSHIRFQPDLRWETDEKLWAWELLSYFHSCSVIATKLAKMAHRKMIDESGERDSDSITRDVAAANRPYSYLSENSWVFHCQMERRSLQDELWFISVDPVVSRQLLAIADPICARYKRLGAVRWRRAKSWPLWNLKDTPPS